MGSSGFAICLILGIALFAVGGGIIAMIMMGIGGVGLLSTVFGGKS